MVVQHCWCRKICKIVCRVSRKRVKSKFLYQDADVIPFADKCIECIVVRSFGDRIYDKVLLETGKFSGNIRFTENRLECDVDRALKSFNSTFQKIGDRLNPLGRLRHPLSWPTVWHTPHMRPWWYCKNLVPWKWDRFPVFRALAQKISQFIFNYGRYWDHLSPYGRIESIEIQNHSRNKVWDSWKEHGILFAADLLFTWEFWMQPNGYSCKKYSVTPCIERMEGFYFGRISDSTSCLKSKRQFLYWQIQLSEMSSSWCL